MNPQETNDPTPQNAEETFIADKLPEFNELFDSDLPSDLVEPSVEPNAQKPLASSCKSSIHSIRWFLLALVFYALYLCFRLVEPFLDTIIFGIVFSAILHPLYSKLKGKIPGPHSIGEAVASLLVVLAMVILVGVPLFIFLRSFIPQATQSVEAITQWLGSRDVEQEIVKYWEPFVAYIKVEYPMVDLSGIDLHKSLIELSRESGQYLLKVGSVVVRSTTTFIMHLFLLLFVMFFLLKDGTIIVNNLKKLIPIRAAQGDRILNTLRKISRVVLLGGFLVAGLQGLVGGIGLAVVGIPGLFWGTVMAFAALIPILGTGLVWVPATAYLIFTEPWWVALFFALYNLIIVSSIDTFLRPLLMRDGANASVFFIFLSILGGLNIFGMLGLLYGPVILTFCGVMLSIYADEFSEFLLGKG